MIYSHRHIIARDSKSPFLIFALIIGINTYANAQYSDLRGAVSDAEAMRSFLIGDLHVPEENIVSLLNSMATRARIIGELKALKTNCKIKRGDGIIVFFAGHGTANAVPELWRHHYRPDSRIESICPSDLGIKGEDGTTVHGIPDFILAKLLRELSDAKGDNIVGWLQ